MLPLHSRNILLHFTIPLYLFFLTFLIIILPLKKNANSHEIKLIWDSYEEEDHIVGYKIFCREEGQYYDYNNPIWEGTEKFCTIFNLDDKKIYYFVSRALNIHGIDSNDSNEIRYPTQNSPAIASAKSISTYEDTPIEISLTAMDMEHDPLTYTIVTQPSHGTLSGTAPNLTYTPNTNYAGSDSFSFKVNDGVTDSNTADVSITIYPIDDPTDVDVDPLADCRSYEDSEDGNINVWTVYDQDPSGASISNVFDADRQSLVIEFTGAFRDYCYLLQNADGSKWNNSSQFVLNWSMKYSNYFIVYIDIHTTAGDKYLYYTPVDLDALGDGYYIQHGLGSKVTDGEWHSFERNLQADLEEAQPGVSILEVNSFMVYGSGRVDDIVLCNNLSTDTNDTPINSPPIADNNSITTAEDTPKDITLSATDVDLDPLTYTILTQPSNGTVSGTAPNLTYLPNTNYNGSDSFTFKANDGHGDSNIATVNINITLVNDTPVASTKVFTTQEDVAINDTLSASDIDGDGLTYAIVTNGGKGNAYITNTSTGAFNYTPNNDVNGTDTFRFKVNDGTTDSATATVTVNITPVNDAPVADTQSLGTDENTALGIILTGSDGDGDSLTYIIVTQPSLGTLSGTVPNLTYTPDTNYAGSDSFSFKVNDGVTDSNTADVSITIYSVDDPTDADPLADCRIYEDSEDGDINGWTIYDQDPSGASISNVFDADRQSLVIEFTGAFRDYCYLLQNADGSKWNNSSQFVLNWSMKYSNYFIVYIDIHTTAGDKYLYYTPADLDALGDGYYIQHGLGSKVTDGQWHSFERNLQADLEEAQPGVSILEVNSFMVYGSGRVDDIVLCNNLSTDTNDIPINSPPIADNNSIITDEDTPMNITLNATDTDLDPLAYTVLTQPLHGALSGTAPNLTYLPNTNYNGPDTFTFKANDGHGDSNIATVNISITLVNDTPVADTQSLGTDENTALGIILTGSDVDGDLLSYIPVTQPSHGTLSGTVPNLTYTPNTNYAGSDSFSFKVNDGVTDSNTAFVSISVALVNTLPAANTQSITTAEDTPKDITLTASDTDLDPLAYTVLTQPLHGTLSGTAPNLTYLPNTNYNGSDSFTFKVNDGTTDSATATVTVNITPVNDAPVADTQSLGTDENTALGIILTGSDVDGDLLGYIPVTQPSHGTLSGTVPNLTYTPDTNYAGSDSFSFKVNDGVIDSNTADVSITIYPVDDPTDPDPLADCRIYEDSEDGNINGWTIYDQDPSGASISNVFDADRQSLVIELTGAFRDYCYLLQDADGSKWNNSNQFVIHWSMKYSNYFIVYIDIHTTAGDKYLYYTPADLDALGDGYYIQHGLGSKVTDGQWHSFERNLQADLEEAQPGVSILEVNSFMVYGSGCVDDIVLCNNP